MATLVEALKESSIEVAELWTDGKMVVVGKQEYEVYLCDNGNIEEIPEGYAVDFKIGDMPPYTSDFAETVEEAEQIVASAAIPYALGSDWWEPRKGEGEDDDDEEESEDE